MRTSELERFQSYQRKSPFRSRSRKAAYMRRYWWKRKLRKMGVPEDELDKTVEEVLKFRARQCWDNRHPGKSLEWKRAWYKNNAEYICEYQKNYYANKQRAERQKLLMAMGG